MNCISQQNLTYLKQLMIHILRSWKKKKKKKKKNKLYSSARDYNNTISTILAMFNKSNLKNINNHIHLHSLISFLDRKLEIDS